MRIAIGADHGGYEIKKELVRYLNKKGESVEDLGADNSDSCDYPEYAYKVARAVGAGSADMGILICKSGIGMSIAANKVPGVRAALVLNKEMASSAREHNDANVLSLASNYTDAAAAKEFADIFLSTKPLSGRHAKRVKQIEDIEKKY